MDPSALFEFCPLSAYDRSPSTQRNHHLSHHDQQVHVLYTHDRNMAFSLDRFAVNHSMWRDGWCAQFQEMGLLGVNPTAAGEASWGNSMAAGGWGTLR